MSTVVAPAPLKLARLRTPIVLIAIGCVITLVAFGPRSTLGQFLSPLSFDRGWGREAFSLAIAIQNILWGAAGAAQPFAGAVAAILGPGHHIATDSKGNIYLAQTTAGMQKLIFKGMSPTQ